MRILHFFLTLAFAILVKCDYSDSSNPLPNSTLNYLSSLQRAVASPDQVTSYILAVQWPPGVCTGESGVDCKIVPVPTEFTIHGLCPQPNGAPSTKPFDVQQIANLTGKLSKNWPNLAGSQQRLKENLEFWLAEWIKHGKYSGLEGRKYYEKSLELLDERLKAKLAEMIKPTVDKTYKLEEIQAAVKKINGGFSGTITCVQRKLSNQQQIQEIRFRYNNTFQKQNNWSPSNYAPEILFPALV